MTLPFYDRGVVSEREPKPGSFLQAVFEGTATTCDYGVPGEPWTPEDVASARGETTIEPKPRIEGDTDADIN